MKKNALLIYLRFAFSFIGLVSISQVKAQIPFEKTYSKIQSPDWFVHQSINHIEQTPLGGYLGVGAYNPTGAPWTSDWYINIWRINANGDTLWVKTLQAPYEGVGTNWSPVHAAVTTNGGMYILFRKYRPDYNYNGILKVDANGDTLWTKVISSTSQYANGNFNKVYLTLDGGCIVAGGTSFGPTSPILVKLNANGITDWSTTNFPAEQGYNKFNDVCIASDGGYIATGLVHNNIGLVDKMIVSKVDSTGANAWNKVFNSGNLSYGDSIKSEGFAVAPDNDGGCFAGGYQTMPGLMAKNAFMVRLNNNGDTLWTKKYFYDLAQNAVGLKIFKTNDNHLIFYTSTNYGNTSDVPRLSKVTFNGDTLWTQIGYYNYFGWNVKPTSIYTDNSILFAGSSSNDANYAKFFHVTTSGIFRAPSLFLPLNQEIGVNINPTLYLHSQFFIHQYSNFQFQLSIDSNFTNLLIDVAGVIADSLNVNGLADNTTYFWRVKGFGADTTSTPWSEVYSFTTGIFSGLHDEESPMIEIYPNPFSESAFIHLNKSSAFKMREICVYNAEGRLISNLSSHNFNGQYLWETSNLEDGLYFIRIINSNGKSQVVKAIKAKKTK
jgi:hypothetical protein